MRLPTRIDERSTERRLPAISRVERLSPVPVRPLTMMKTCPWMNSWHQVVDLLIFDCPTPILCTAMYHHHLARSFPASLLLLLLVVVVVVVPPIAVWKSPMSFQIPWKELQQQLPPPRMSTELFRRCNSQIGNDPKIFLWKNECYGIRFKQPWRPQPREPRNPL